MANSIRTLDRILEWTRAQGPGQHHAFVSQRWINWYISNHAPRALTGAVSRLIQVEPGCELLVGAQAGIGRFAKGDYVMVEHFANGVLDWAVHRVGEFESKNGFLPCSDYKPKLLEFWDVIHWLSHDSRIDLVSIPTVSYPLTKWKFNDENLTFEFRMQFDV